ncbi:MAG: hypothetical protein ACYSW1_14575, partial [Planctomycetota bacterium]
ILDGTPADSPHAGFLERLADVLPHQVRLVAWREVGEAMAQLAAELKRRTDAGDTDAPGVYVLVNGLQRFRMLRRTEEDFGFSADDAEKPPAPDKQFAELLREGPVYGMHVLAWCDTATNLERSLERQGLREFDNRVLFQMSAPDSTTLIDSTAASKLGLHRALLFNEERVRQQPFRRRAVEGKRAVAGQTRAKDRLTGCHAQRAQRVVRGNRDDITHDSAG